MEDGEQYLSEDANAAERAAAETVMTGLQNLRLEATVKRVASQRAARARQKRWLLALLAVLTLGGILGIWWWQHKTDVGTESPTTPETSSTTPLKQNRGLSFKADSVATVLDTAATLEGKESAAPLEIFVPQRQRPERPPEKEEAATEDLGPIARLEPWEGLAPPTYPAPRGGLRGGGTDEDARRERLNALWYVTYPLNGLRVAEPYRAVDSLLRQRAFPRAFLALNRLSGTPEGGDTLKYLQAYTYLEMGRGKEAVGLLESLETPAESWQTQLDWYRGLGYLLSGQDEKAITVFREMSSQEQHPFYRQSSKALHLMDQ